MRHARIATRRSPAPRYPGRVDVYRVWGSLRGRASGVSAPAAIIAAMDMPATFDRIADFQFVRLLGSGTFAQTFEAVRGDRRYAVKVLNELPAGPEARERFRREVASLRIEHPNLAEYVQSGIAPFAGRPAAFIAMRYLPGRSLREHLSEHGGVPWRQALTIAGGIAGGLQALHEHGTVHRDLKPANIYLPGVGGVVILDFGLARVQDLTTITARGVFVGTLAFCAPEQIRGEPDFHSDLYALGAVLFTMLTGRPPFPAANELELIERIRRENPEPPGAIEASVPPWLDGLVLNLLAKEPLQRPHSAASVLDALQEPSGPGGRVARDPYDRDASPLLVIRAGTKSASGAMLDAAMQGSSPDVAIASITQPGPLDELHRARALAPVSLAVDTRIADTATGGFAAVAALRGRGFLPGGSEPHTPTSLRAPGETERVARADVAEQLKEGASLLRSAGFPFAGLEDGWLRRDPRLLDASLAARDAFAPTLPMFALLSCTVDALAHRDERLSIVNRFARGEPDGFWVGVAGVEGCAPEQLLGAIDLVLMLQQLGAPCLWILGSELAELAWSLGIAGVEVALGRAGGFRLPSSYRRFRGLDPAPRFVFPSIMTSLPASLAAVVLDSGLLPESDCACIACAPASSTAERLARADTHNLSAWLDLRDTLAALSAERRLERFQQRLAAGAANLKAVRGLDPRLRSLRHVTYARRTFELVLAEGILRTGDRLRRSA
jgi:serine/threonine protein kinase